MHWLWFHAGLNNGNSSWYLFPSGWGGILLVSGSILTAPYVAWKRNNCAVHRCWRIARHKVPGTDHACCRKHTPGGAPTHAHILRAHREHQEARQVDALKAAAKTMAAARKARTGAPK